MKISENGINLIKKFEGLRLEAYQPVVGDVWTIGYGSTQGVRKGDKIDVVTADRYLLRDLAKFENCVNNFVTVTLNQNEYDACCCLTYNIGCSAFSGSTLLKMINKKEWQNASNEFLRWDKFHGTPLPGLARRRELERELFLSA